MTDVLEIPPPGYSLALFLHNSTQRARSENVRSQLRKTLDVSLNCGVSLPHLKTLKFKLQNRQNFTFSPDQFDHTVISFKSLTERNEFDFKKAFKVPMDSFKNDLRQNSSEYCFTGLCWNPIFTIAFRNGLKLRHQNVKFRLAEQWDLRSLVPEQNSRRADYAAVLESLSNAPEDNIGEIPIFMVEAGIEELPKSLMHKDLTKITCMMSSSCVELAYALIERQRNPDLARIYGLLIGATKARLLVAQPMFKEIDGRWHICVVISGEEEWTIDLLNESELPSIRSHVSKRSCAFYESTVLATEPLPNLDELVVVGVESLSEQDTGSVRREPIPFTRPIKVAALKKAVFIAEMVKARISLLRSAAARDGPNRTYAPKPFPGNIPVSLRTSSAITPRKGRKRHNEYFQQSLATDRVPRTPSRDPIETIVIGKPFNSLERKITCDVDLFLAPFFPRMYGWEFDEKDPQFINYRFEKMLPLFEEDSEKRWRISSQFFPDNPVEFTLEFAKFFLDCSFNLFLLHSRARIVHSDLSPRNIMYSQLNRMWKLIDYDRAMRIEDSLKTQRVAGTEGFIAPEALKTGIFTFESDIWSLGRLLFACFFARTSSCYEKAKWLDAVLDKLRNLIFSMTLNDPAQRPALPLVIRGVYGVIGKFAYGHLTHRGDLILDAVAKYIAIWDEEEANLHAEPTIAKRPKSSGQTI